MPAGLAGEGAGGAAGRCTGAGAAAGGAAGAGIAGLALTRGVAGGRR